MMLIMVSMAAGTQYHFVCLGHEVALAKEIHLEGTLGHDGRVEGRRDRRRVGDGLGGRSAPAVERRRRRHPCRGIERRGRSDPAPVLGSVGAGAAASDGAGSTIAVVDAGAAEVAGTGAGTAAVAVQAARAGRPGGSGAGGGR